MDWKPGFWVVIRGSVSKNEKLKGQFGEIGVNHLHTQNWDSKESPVKRLRIGPDWHAAMRKIQMSKDSKRCLETEWDQTMAEKSM